MAGLYKGRASGGSEAQPQLRLFPPFKYHSNKKQKPLFPRLEYDLYLAVVSG